LRDSGSMAACIATARPRAARLGKHGREHVKTQAEQPTLNRTLSLAQATLYGLGVTIGAGIYVLIGAAAARSAMSAPIAFLVAAVVMSLTAASFAELVGRVPVAAGEAAYARVAFNSDALATAVGLFVVCIAIVSASAISVGTAGYMSVFVGLPEPVLVTVVVFAMGAVAAWGIKESVLFAGALTLIETAGLVLIVVTGILFVPDLFFRFAEALPSFAVPGTTSALLSTTLLAVFAFIGFESLANVAEEVRDPAITLPKAIFLTLVISTILYMLVIWVALVAVPLPELINSSAPLALVFERVTGASPRIMSAIALIATLNGIVVQIIMASRVLYGLGRQGQLPSIFGKVNARSRTPTLATAVTVALVLLFALFLPLHELADLASRLTLLVFAMANLSLAWIKRRGDPPPEHAWIVPTWVPWAGCVSCLALFVIELSVGDGM
jgi:APA family basic amino acid/polyamine antiporter